MDNRGAALHIAPAVLAALTRRGVLRAAAPLMVANLSTPIVGLVDTAVVGRTGGAEDLAAVALGALIFNFLYWAVGFLRMGTTGLTAQAAGSGDEREVAALLLRGCALGAGFGLVFVAVQVPVRELAFAALSGAPAVEATGRAYFDARIWGAPAALVGFTMYGWLIALGQTKKALALQVVLNLLNVALDVAFVYGLGLGAPGVAAAAAVSQWLTLGVGALVVKAALEARGETWPGLRAALAPAAVRRMLFVNVDIFLRSLALLAGIAWFNEASAREGTTVLAANAILLQVISATAYFLDAFAHVTEAEVGRAVGAASVARLRQSILRTTELAAVCALACGALIWLGGPWGVAAMTTDPATRAVALAHLGYCALVPILGFPSWQIDGVMLGATRGPLMRNAMAVALGLYLALDAVLRPAYGSDGLWIAFLAYYVFRFLTLLAGYPALERSVRVGADPASSPEARLER